MRFEWDSVKARTNEQKHKTTFLESCYIFSDEYILTLFDDKHSENEDRWISIGKTPNGKIIVVVHTYKTLGNEEIIRIISARPATKSENTQYYQRRDLA